MTTISIQIKVPSLNISIFVIVSWIYLVENSTEVQLLIILYRNYSKKFYFRF